jgi:hypothetical protein
MRVSLITLLLLICAAEFTFAQSFYNLRRQRNFMVHGGSGIASYHGDLVNPGTLGRVRYNLVIGGEYHLNQRISLRPELIWFRIFGSDEFADSDRVLRNINFFSNNVELSGVTTFHLLKTGRFYYERPAFNVYGFGGVGLLYMNPKTTRDNGQVVALQPIQTEGTYYSRFQPVIPYGLGVKMQVNILFNIIIEGGNRLVFTDYLDDVSTRRYHDHPDAGYVLTDPIAIELNKRGNASVRGNPENNDGYFFLNIKLQYYLPPEFGLRTSDRKLRTIKRNKPNRN